MPSRMTSAHGAGIVMRPHRLRAEIALGRVEPCRDLVERLVPGNPRELARALRPDAAMRIDQPVRMMDAFGVAADLGADHARRIGLQLGTAHPADRGIVDHFDIERAGRRAIVRAGGMPDVDLGALIHAAMSSIKNAGRRGHLSAMPRQKPPVCHAQCAEIGPAIGADRPALDMVRARPAQDTRRFWRDWAHRMLSFIPGSEDEIVDSPCR